MTTVHDHQAFPAFNNHGECLTSTEGLTKREYFAAIALQGLIAGNSLIVKDDPSYHFTAVDRAAAAVHYADYLIVELNREGLADG